MGIKEKSREELEKRVDKLENMISEKGVGSGYLQRAERAQRDLNLALLVGTTAVVLGLTAWTLYHFNE